MKREPSNSERGDTENGTRLSNYPAVSLITIHGWASLLFSLPFLVAGGVIILVSLEFIHVNPASIHAPMWVLGVAGGVFFLAGFAVFLNGIVGMIRLARSKSRSEAHPDEPWFADYNWNPEGIESRQTNSIIGHFFGFTITAGLLSVMNWAAFTQEGGGLFLFVAGVFDLIFIFVMSVVVKMVIARFKYGRPVLEFGDFPARPDKLLRVRVVSQQDVGEADSMVATLRYIEERYETHGTGKNRSQIVVCYQQYCDKQELHGSDSRKIALGGLELEFRLPDDAQSSNLRGRPASYWDLELRAEVPGVDFVHRFLVPVYGEMKRDERLAA